MTGFQQERSDEESVYSVFQMDGYAIPMSVATRLRPQGICL
jgi:hypothetical protein